MTGKACLMRLQVLYHTKSYLGTMTIEAAKTSGQALYHTKSY